MSYAFQVTEEDVIQASLNKLLIDLSYDQAEKVLQKLDLQKVENEALEGLEMDEQTELAHVEIVKQMKENKILDTIL